MIRRKRTSRAKGTPAPPNPIRRGLVLLGVKAAVVTGLGLRLRQLQVEQAETFRLLAEENRINIRLIPPERGLIFDRNGQVLAENRQNYRITLVREQAGDVDAVLAKLATLIDLPPEAQEAVKRDSAKRSAFVPVTVAEHLSWDALARVAANAPACPVSRQRLGSPAITQTPTPWPMWWAMWGRCQSGISTGSKTRIPCYKSQIFRSEKQGSSSAKRLPCGAPLAPAGSR